VLVLLLLLVLLLEIPAVASARGSAALHPAQAYRHFEADQLLILSSPNPEFVWIETLN
jgi:hypothetical protein